MRIQFNNFKIDTISNSSGVYSGENQQMKYKHVSKQNQAFGKLAGQGNLISYARVKLSDSDQIDLNLNTKFQK